MTAAQSAKAIGDRNLILGITPFGTDHDNARSMPTRLVWNVVTQESCQVYLRMIRNLIEARIMPDQERCNSRANLRECKTYAMWYPDTVGNERGIGAYRSLHSLPITVRFTVEYLSQGNLF